MEDVSVVGRCNVYFESRWGIGARDHKEKCKGKDLNRSLKKNHSTPSNVLIKLLKPSEIDCKRDMNTENAVFPTFDIIYSISWGGP